MSHFMGKNLSSLGPVKYLVSFEKYSMTIAKYSLSNFPKALRNFQKVPLVHKRDSNYVYTAGHR